jgi:hypothetical protein
MFFVSLCCFSPYLFISFSLVILGFIRSLVLRGLPVGGLGSEKLDGRVVAFPLDQPQWVNVHDPLARGGIKSKEKLRHR